MSSFVRGSYPVFSSLARGGGAALNGTREVERGRWMQGRREKEAGEGEGGVEGGRKVEGQPSFFLSFV